MTRRDLATAGLVAAIVAVPVWAGYEALAAGDIGEPAWSDDQFGTVNARAVRVTVPVAVGTPPVRP